jgi:hypothetical protein
MGGDLGRKQPFFGKSGAKTFFDFGAWALERPSPRPMIQKSGSFSGIKQLASLRAKRSNTSFAEF